MHKHIKKAAILLVLCTSILLVGCGAKSNAEALAKFGEEQFMANDAEQYIQGLRDACGLSDLDIVPSVSYSYEYDYDKDTKKLYAECHLSFTSDEIDNYYTTEYNKPSSDKLAEVLGRLKNAYYEEPTYTYTNEKGTVVLKITNGVSDVFYVRTSSGREYSFDYYVDFDKVEIDGEWVYHKEVRNDYASTATNSYTGTYDAKLKYGSGSVLICASEDAMERYMTALNNGYQGTIDEMITNGEIAYTEQNTKCNIVDKKITKAQVKLLDGSYAGNTVWVIIESLQEE